LQTSVDKTYFKVKILRLKYTKFDFGWGSAPNPAGGAYSAPPDPLAGFEGPTSKGRGRGGKGREERRGERRGEKRKKWAGEMHASTEDG